ncbi:MAG: Fur family transcriptional regulator [Paracoccaceae bacterium]
MTTTSNAFARHDHRRCRSVGMNEARRRCLGEGLRLTPIRARVLEILLETHRALGAYDILQRLSAEGMGHQPPMVYRALDFLVGNGLVHRLERLNAFTACATTGAGHEALFLICSDCRRVAETPLDTLANDIDAPAAALGFEVRSRMVEIVGRCPACRARTET